MASLRDIRKRIRSTTNMQKITKAQKLVAASKLRRAQDAITQARPYAQELSAMLSRVAARAAQTEADGDVHPLLALRPPQRVLLVVLTSDRGSCGAFNSNILRRAERFIRENQDRFTELEVATIGRKGREFFKRKKIATVRDFPNLTQNLNYERVEEVAQALVKEYLDKNLDAVFLIYNEFRSAMNQVVTVRDVLPVVAEELPAAEVGVDYIYEPSQMAVLDSLVPQYVAVNVWRALLESAASEHGARMTAMDSASKNARDLTDALTLQYNRGRQAAITRELMEIIGGAEALKG